MNNHRMRVVDLEAFKTDLELVINDKSKHLEVLRKHTVNLPVDVTDTTTVPLYCATLVRTDYENKVVMHTLDNTEEDVDTDIPLMIVSYFDSLEEVTTVDDYIIMSAGNLVWDYFNDVSSEVMARTTPYTESVVINNGAVYIVTYIVVDHTILNDDSIKLMKDGYEFRPISDVKITSDLRKELLKGLIEIKTPTEEA